ncbi:MAG TPA: hypothetical protein VJN96_09445 [Vicinamibacterales bacterium]|nr:hypothetical protein [Vicinamibacterales bacterium]
MTDCCCPEPAIEARRQCPVCAAPGLAVEALTLKALLAPTAMARLTHVAFYFCAAPSCDTVYFAQSGEIFRTADLRVAVWQKQPAGSRTLCYCFGENEADMQGELETQGKTLAVERVRQHVAARRCACEIRNPRGACCLADLVSATKRLKASAGAVS